MLRLVNVLRSNRGIGIADLALELGVSRRTVFRDMEALDTVGVPCYFEAGKGYQIASEAFLPAINLTVPETLSLMLLCKSASGVGRRGVFGPAVSAVNKLVSTVPGPIRQACAEVMANGSFNPGAEVAGGSQMSYYWVLQRCIDEGRACRMGYRSPVEPGAIQCELEPYAMHFSARAWYVLGKADVFKEVRVFKLVRIRSLEATDRIFVRPRRFRAADKIGEAWQLIPEGKMYDIELEFSARVAMNVSEVMWHRSQGQRMLRDGRCRMSFRVDGVGEISWWVCGYADQVRVIKPRALRERVRGILRAACDQYGGRGQLRKTGRSSGLRGA